MTDTSTTALKGDRPLRRGEEDKLGFRETARRIAISLVDHSSNGGLVVGIEGKWGSGKSSLLSLIERELEELPEDQKPSVVSFRPWLVGNRDTLLANLFALLKIEIDEVVSEASDAPRALPIKAKAAAEALRKFVAGLGRAGAIVEVAGDATGFSPLTWIGRCLKALRSYGKDKSAETPLDELKENLVRSLRDLGHRFIITIDDVDRLEPVEAIEVLRLARSVADFPNVIYLLCYDREVLSHSIEQAAGIKSGQSYIEKIVQLTVMVPTPEPFQLRQWFGEELQSIGSAKNDDELARLQSIIDSEGARQLKSPRSVVRVLDSIRFFWPSLRDTGADLADLVWLQLLKSGNSSLYIWVEEYYATAAVLSLGNARIDDSHRAKQLAALHETVETGYFENDIYKHYFSEQLPGFEIDYSKDGDGFKLHQKISDGTLYKAINNRRISSPDHYRLYFTLSGPSHALTHKNFDTFWSAFESGTDQMEDLILELHTEDFAGSLGKADVLFERIKGVTHKVLTAAQSKVLLIALSNVMDKCYRTRPFDIYWVNSLWDRAERLVPVLLSQLSANERESTLDTMFKDGKAVGWLTTLFRRDTFSQGRYGDQQRPEYDWLFTGAELDRIAEIMISRYRAMSSAEVLAVINPASMLFAWQQGGDEDGPRQIVKSCIETDEGLIETLERLTTKIHSSDRGSFSVIRKDNIERFLDYTIAEERIKALQANEMLSGRAKNLAEAFDDGKE